MTLGEVIKRNSRDVEVPGDHVLFTMEPDILCVLSMELAHTTLSAPQILSWLVDFRTIFLYFTVSTEFSVLSACTFYLIPETWWALLVGSYLCMPVVMTASLA